MKALLLIAIMGLIIAPTGCVTNQRGFPPKDQIVNFDKVDDHLYRGAQPNQAGLEALAKAGVKTVINLRMPDDGWALEYAACKELGMAYLNHPMTGMTTPSAADIEAVLKAVNDAQGIVFVHCQYGCDRTGITVACYRIRKGMSNEDAFNDAIFHGISKLLPGFRHAILKFK